MTLDRVDVFSDIGIMLVCLAIGLGALAALTMLALKSYRLSHPLLGWFGVFLTVKRREQVLLVVLLCRVFVAVSVLFTDAFVSLPMLCYVLLSVTVCAGYRNWKHILFEVLYSVEMTASFYLLQVLKQEAARAQAQSGMGLLIWIAGIFLFGMLAGQFLCGLPKLLSAKEAMEAYQPATEEEKKTEKRMNYLFALPLLFAVLPACMLMQVSYVSCEVPVYQMKEGKAVRYNAGGRVRQGDGNCLLVVDGESVTLDTMPLLFDGKEQMLFTSVYSVVQPTLQLSSRVRAMSVLQKDGENYTIAYDDKEVAVEDFFFFDGKDSYVFPAGTTLQWNEESLTVSSACLVTAKYNQYIAIYEVINGEYRQIPTEEGYCTALLPDRTQVNMSTDIMYRENGQEQMLFMQPSLLSDLE